MDNQVGILGIDAATCQVACKMIGCSQTARDHQMFLQFDRHFIREPGKNRFRIEPFHHNLVSGRR